MHDVRPITETDFPAILALNDAEVRQTSTMNLERLEMLVRLAALSTVATAAGQVVAFLIAFQHGAPYENANYNWFSARFARFMYVDRIVVDARFAGHGIGRSLYENLFAFAREKDIGTITCEYNLIPPNPASRAFHARFGFRELGTQWVADGTKLVSLQAADA